MTLPVHVSSEAVAELDDAITWYDEKRIGLGGEFMDAVEEAVEATADRGAAAATATW